MRLSCESFQSSSQVCLIPSCYRTPVDHRYHLLHAKTTQIRACQIGCQQICASVAARIRGRRTSCECSRILCPWGPCHILARLSLGLGPVVGWCKQLLEHGRGVQRYLQYFDPRSGCQSKMLQQLNVRCSRRVASMDGTHSCDSSVP
jgi:hypothetical protein